MNCPLCKREMVEGPSLDLHHLIPKSKKGKETILIHKICHRKIHSVFKENEIAKKYNTIEKLLENEEIQKFVAWVGNKHPEFLDSFKDNRKKYK